MSMPRAAMSVATRTRYLPLLKPASASVRWDCERLPWMRSALIPVLDQLRLQPVGAVLGAREDERLLHHRCAGAGAGRAPT